MRTREAKDRRSWSGVSNCQTLTETCLNWDAAADDSEAVFRAKLTYNVCRVLVLAVDCFIHRPHVVGGDLAGEHMKSAADLRPSLKGIAAHQRYSLIGRKVVAIIQ